MSATVGRERHRSEGRRACTTDEERHAAFVRPGGAPPAVREAPSCVAGITTGQRVAACGRDEQLQTPIENEALCEWMRPNSAEPTPYPQR